MSRKERQRAEKLAAGYVILGKGMQHRREHYGATKWEHGRLWVPPERVAEYRAETTRRMRAQQAQQAQQAEAWRNWRCACGSQKRVGCCSNADCNLEVCGCCGAPAP